MKLQIALLGNANSGKTSLFNELTGGNKSVGNWTGVTMSQEAGYFHYQDRLIEIVDLPGLYSLHTPGPEQRIVKEYLLQQKPQLIINVVDVTNLERSLYLTLQLRELGLPMLLALNMWDELASQGLRLQLQTLCEKLGLPCLPISATQRQGLDKLLAAALDLAASPLDKPLSPAALAEAPAINRRAAGDLAEQLYRQIAEIMPLVLIQAPYIHAREGTRRLDGVLCHPIWALPIFLLLMAGIFALAFGPPGQLLSQACAWLLEAWLPGILEKLLFLLGAGEMSKSLLIEGMLAGVGSILVFLPQLVILFFCLALLEYSGYMARAAFITDRLLARFGLSGMSFIPMILGFGCSVPAIMATRVLENKRERLLTMAVIPFMSCGARMPVYALFAGTFFPGNPGRVIFSLYGLGIIVGLLSAVLLRPLLMAREQPLFLMEMPPYRKPVWHCVGRNIWLRARDFIARAGSIILLASIIIWFLSHFSLSLGYTPDGKGSILQSLGQLLAPLFIPLGFGYWPFAVALLSGFLAKEAVLASLSVLLAAGEGLGLAISAWLSPAAAYSFLVFVLLYTPCIATVAVMRRESGSIKFLWGYIAYQFLAAWLIALVIYRIILCFI